jgi:hypothetical protein
MYINPVICIVNGKATNGTEDAPVLASNNTAKGSSNDRNRVDVIQGNPVIAVSEIQEAVVAMEVPRSGMFTRTWLCGAMLGELYWLALIKTPHKCTTSSHGFWDPDGIADSFGMAGSEKGLANAPTSLCTVCGKSWKAVIIPARRTKNNINTGSFVSVFDTAKILWGFASTCNFEQQDVLEAIQKCDA